MEKINNELLGAIRKRLLGLHETLAVFQVREYERVSGKVRKRGQLYELLASHPEFHWLRSLSGLIVSLDEFIEQDQPPAQSKDLVKYIKKLLKPDEAGNEFSQKYHLALQSSADVLIEHGQLKQILKKV